MGWSDPEYKKAWEKEYRKTPQYIAYQKAYRKEYYRKNKKKKKEQADTPERKAYMKEYAKKNKQKLKEYREAYYKENKKTKWKNTSGWKRNLDYEKEYNHRPEVIKRRSELNKIRYDNRSEEQIEMTRERRRVNRLKRLKDPLERKKIRDYHRIRSQKPLSKLQSKKYCLFQVENLTDQYIINRLKSTGIINPDKIMIGIRRLSIQIEREIKSINN